MDTLKLEEILTRHRGELGALLPILHEVQEVFGYIPPEVVPYIAKELNLSRAEVHGVITYYPNFYQEKKGKYRLHICRAEACKALGADALLAHAQAHLRCKLHSTTTDGEISLEPVFCLGQCAIGPALMINNSELHGHMDSSRFDTLINDLKSRKG